MEQVIGVKGGKFMSNKIKYTDQDLEFGEVIEDFLPLPSQLIPKQKTVEIKINLTEEKLLLIEKEAKTKRISYQDLIESIIDNYIPQLES